MFLRLVGFMLYLRLVVVLRAVVRLAGERLAGARLVVVRLVVVVVTGLRLRLRFVAARLRLSATSLRVALFCAAVRRFL